MDNNKLYNALLKTQTEQDKRRRQESQANTDIPSPGRRYASKPTISVPDSGAPEHAPTLYDSAVSLDLINNPNPFSIKQLKERKIIYPSMRNKAILNAFREIRIKLRDDSGEENFSVMLSSLSNKSSSVLTAYNLAVSFAMDSQTSALLVDCNPYDQDLERLVSVPLDFGITDFVADKSLGVKDIIYPSGVDRLSVIPAGYMSTSAVELFSSVRMKELMSELKYRYPDRYIVLHAPSFRISTEARILVRYADKAVLAVPFGEITLEDILTSVDELGTKTFSGLIYQE